MSTPNLTPQPLIAQEFSDECVTLVPKIDFSTLVTQTLPMIYQNAPNFMGMMFSTAILKQEIYDIVRSLANVYNLYSSGNVGDEVSRPVGPYLKMLATDLNAPFNSVDDDATITQSIINRINSVASRGKPADFFNYFAQNGISSYFTNYYVEETGNATVFFYVPIEDDNLLVPNPIQVFKQNMEKIKAAGVKLVITSNVDVHYFWLAGLAGELPANGSTFAGLNIFNEPLGGGFFKSV